MEKKEDSAKTLQTKQILVTKLEQLLEEQSFKKISVNDICQSALISRSAFYLHFQDKYDLLRYCIACELEKCEAVMRTSDIDTFLVFTLGIILEKRKVYYNAIVAEPNQEVTDIFQQLFSRFLAEPIEKLQSGDRRIPGTVSIISAFYAGGIVCSIIQWIRNGFDSSIEEMAACQKQLLSAFVE